MNAPLRLSLHTLLLAAALSAPASALDNPVVVDLHAASAATSFANATIFQHGNAVLVNVTGKSGIPKNAALTLNGGSCSNPGGVEFALAPFEDNQSMTQLRHSLSEIAGKAKSMVVHQTASAASPPFACGNLKG